MSIFLLPTTPKNAVPSAAESKALSNAHRLFSAGSLNEARLALFSVFSPAAAEEQYEQIKQRLTPKAPVITATVPKDQSSPMAQLVTIGLFAGFAYLAFNALTRR